MALPVEINPLQLKTSVAYSISKSLRFRSSASAYLNRTFGTPTSSTVYTWSGWVKRGALGATNYLFGASTTTNFGFNSSNNIVLTLAGTTAVTTTAVYRDPSAWYHVVYQQNGAAQTISINGVSAGTGTTANTVFNTAIAHQLGAANTASYFDGYIAEVNFVDGQALTPSSFGTYDANGVWQPKKYSGTYGTNGFYLPFGTTTTTATLGNDSSGNGNTWTVNNVSLTAGTTYDSMTDSPTVSSATVANYAVLNPLDIGSLAPSSGNLWMVQPAVTHSGVRGTFRMPTTGKWYFEAINLKDQTPGTISSFIGLATSAASMTTHAYNTTGTYGIYGANSGNGIVTNGSLGANSITPFPANAVLQLAYDSATGNLWLGVNNVYYNSTAGTTGNPSAGTNPTITVAASLGLAPYLELLNNSLYANFGQQPFTYTAPTGFNALNTYNLPTPTIANGASYMAATTYTGTGASLTIANSANNTIGTTFQPDFVWMKGRSGATDHALYDVVRGTTKDLVSNTTAAETTQATGLTAFGSTGFTIGALAKINTSAATYVGWQWLAGNSSGVSNTNGSITSTVSANTTAGFSIVTYTGTGASNPTIGHGLGVTPNMIILKDRNTNTNNNNWQVYHSSLTSGYFLVLNATDAQSAISATSYGSVGQPTSTTFKGVAGSVDSTTTNQNTQLYVAYCWSAVAGYSAFGSYTGNGSADGPFVYTGFRPRFLLVKKTDTVESWSIVDTSRDTYNQAGTSLFPNLTNAESTNNLCDLLSNGFKLRNTWTGANTSGGTYIYAAFAENPFNSSRAR